MRAQPVAASGRTRPPTEALLLFGGILVLALLSVLIPGGPQRPAWFVAAWGLTACVAVLGWGTPWASAPRWFRVVPLLLATAAIGCLVHSASTSTGLGSLLLLPLLFSAFYGDRWESYVLIPGIGLMQGLIGLSNQDNAIVLARLLVFWVALLVMISLAAHGLRLADSHARWPADAAFCVPGQRHAPGQRRRTDHADFLLRAVTRHAVAEALPEDPGQLAGLR